MSGDAGAARERAALLLAGLVRHGVRDLATVRAVPPLAEVLPDGATLEALAASHHRVFQLEAPPLAGFWLSEDRLVGGPAADAVLASCRVSEFAPKLGDVSADHLAVQLAHLAWVTGTSREGLVARDLLTWLPALEVAVRGLDPFWSRVLELALTLARQLAEPPRFALPPLPDLTGPEVGLRDVARVLCTPALAGGLLTRSALAELGRADRLPAGFGDREQTLANLLRSAGRFDQVGSVLDGLDRCFAELGAAGGAWAARSGETRGALKRAAGLLTASGPA